jgi:GNAT superfamily N-acetyltransferase
LTGAVTVREANPRDAEAILAVNAAGWQHGYRGLVSDERLADLPIERWRAEITTGLREPVADAFTRVAELDGGFAGYCYVAAPGRDEDLEGAAELVALYVEPDLWRTGVGSALIEVVEPEAAARGYELMSLWTFKDNERAVSFYRRHGWELDGSERLHPFADATAVRFRKRLGGPGRPGGGGTAQ